MVIHIWLAGFMDFSAKIRNIRSAHVELSEQTEKMFGLPASLTRAEPSIFSMRGRVTTSRIIPRIRDPILPEFLTFPEVLIFSD